MALVGVRLTPAGRLRYVDDGGLDHEVGRRVTVELDECDGPREAVVAVASGQVILGQVPTAGAVVSAEGTGPSRPRG